MDQPENGDTARRRDRGHVCAATSFKKLENYGDDDDDEEEKEEAYPTADTIPFPYERPYPQQRAFMDVLLSSLQKHRQGSEKSGKNCPVVMLESPTGTGKSLSLACATVAWLRHCERQDLRDCSKETTAMDTVAAKVSLDADDPPEEASSSLDWIEAWTQDDGDSKRREEDGIKVKKEAGRARRGLEKELESIRKRGGGGELRSRAAAMKAAIVTVRATDKRRNRRRYIKAADKKDDNEDFCVEAHYCSDENRSQSDSDDSDEEDMSDGQKEKEEEEGVSRLLHGFSLDGSAALLTDCQQQQRSRRRHGRVGQDEKIAMTVGDVSPGSGVRKVVYAARTHSQLSQFLAEVGRVPCGAQQPLRVATLGSRRLLCNNPKVYARKDGTRRSEAAMNEDCLDLQSRRSSTKRTRDQRQSSSSSTTKASSCPYLANRQNVKTLALHSLAHLSDIEDLAKLGEASHTCSYYASRESLTGAEVVAVPYNILLSKQARESVGLSLRGCLVVVDEAHNLPETMRNLAACRLSLSTMNAALDQLTAYSVKYASRLAGRNVFYLGQVRKCLVAMKRYLETKTTTTTADQTSRLWTATDFLFALQLDNCNLFKVLRYLEKSQLPQKLLGFANQDRQQEEENQPEDKEGEFVSKHVSCLSLVRDFLQCLTAANAHEGKVMVEWKEESCGFSFVLLDPSSAFANVLEEAHAVVLAGGTLRPFTHMTAELLLSRRPLEEEYNKRIQRHAAQADGMSLSSWSSSGALAPEGVTWASPELTTFFCGHVIPPSHVQLVRLSAGPTGTTLDFRHASRSSHAMVDELGRVLVNMATIVPAGLVVFLPSYAYQDVVVRRWQETSVWNTLHRKKSVFQELPRRGPATMERVLTAYAAAASAKPGALLLAVVGGKWSEGINFANDLARGVVVVGLPYPNAMDAPLQEKRRALDATAASSGGGLTGAAYYHNLCLRAVNQSIGRAIRHAKDYAAVVLADARYTTDARVWASLPEWLRHEEEKECLSSPSFGSMCRDLSTFFQRHKPTTSAQSKQAKLTEGSGEGVTRSVVPL